MGHNRIKLFREFNRFASYSDTVISEDEFFKNSGLWNSKEIPNRYPFHNHKLKYVHDCVAFDSVKIYYT